jgi:hypothetical protein
MTSRPSLGELLLDIEGLALLRLTLTGCPTRTGPPSWGCPA